MIRVIGVLALRIVYFWAGKGGERPSDSRRDTAFPADCKDYQASSVWKYFWGMGGTS